MCHDFITKASFFPVKDAPVTSLGHRSGQVAALRLADLLIARYNCDHDCLDVTVVSLLVHE